MLIVYDPENVLGENKIEIKLLIFPLEAFISFSALSAHFWVGRLTRQSPFRLVHLPVNESRPVRIQFFALPGRKLLLF